MEYSYLRDRVFRVKNRGPRIKGSTERAPSIGQIRARCAVIQTAWDARMERSRRAFPHELMHAAESELSGWEVPVVSVVDLAEASEFGADDLAGILKIDDDPA